MTIHKKLFNKLTIYFFIGRWQIVIAISDNSNLFREGEHKTYFQFSLTFNEVITTGEIKNG